MMSAGFAHRPATHAAADNRHLDPWQAGRHLNRRHRARAVLPAQSGRLPGEGHAYPANGITVLDDVPEGWER